VADPGEAGTLTIVGLGPGPAEWVTAGAVAVLRRPGARVFVRTALHPAVTALLGGLPYESFDAAYEAAADFPSLQQEIAGRLLRARDAGLDVVLAVPGDGVVGEALVAELGRQKQLFMVLPGVPLGLGALAAAGIPASDGLQTVDALALGGTGMDLGVELNPRWLALVVGIYNRVVAGEAKLALQRVYPPDHQVTLVRHPGQADGAVTSLALADVDRGQVALDHLTHLVLPPVATSTPTGSAHGLRAITARLRAPTIGCPWDLEQTHQSLVPYVIEEAYEVVDAIQEESPAELADELGDLLLQVALHAEVADQAGEFDWNDVVRGLCAKLIRRHPHVFGEARVAGAADVLRNWDTLKAAERAGQPPRASSLDGIPASYPALKRAAELARKATRAGYPWPDRAATAGELQQELSGLLAAPRLAEQEEGLGDLLQTLARLAWQDGVDPEEALRRANGRFTARFQAWEDAQGAAAAPHC